MHGVCWLWCFVIVRLYSVLQGNTQMRDSHLFSPENHLFIEKSHTLGPKLRQKVKATVYCLRFARFPKYNMHVINMYYIGELLVEK